MTRKTYAAGAIACLLTFTFATAQASEGPHVAPIKAYVQDNVMSWLNDPVVTAAIKAQNQKHSGMSEADILSLDTKWRAETESSDRPMIRKVLNNDLSSFLSKRKNEAAGMITEVFVMDKVGLNVGQSDVTSDYWQGDEAKWQKTYKVGPDAIFVDGIEKDESTQSLQSQVSIAISDESGTPIGAVTLGINVNQL